MPNRIIKDAITASETLAQLSDAEERVWWRLLVVVDDFGRFDGRPNVIRGKACAAFLDRFTDADIAAMVDRFEAVGLVRRYVVDGRPLLQIVTWDRHQQTRAKHSKYPPPPADDGACEQVNTSEIICEQVKSDAPDIREARSEKREARDDARARSPLRLAPVPPDLRGQSLIPAQIPDLAERDPDAGLVLIPRLREHATACGCRDADAAWQHWHAERWKKRGERRTWCTDWLADFEAWMLNHGRYGCPCERKPKPAAAAPVRDFTGVTAEQILAEQLAEDAAFQAAMAKRDAAKAQAAGDAA